MIRHLSLVLGSLLAAALALAEVGGRTWPVALLDHLRFQILLATLLPLAVAAWHRDRLAWAWLALACVTAAPLASLSWPPEKPGAGGPTMTVFHANIDRATGDPARVIRHLQDNSVDVAFLQEVTPQTLPQIAAALGDYRLVLGHPLPSSHGSAIFVHQSAAIRVVEARILTLPQGSSRPLLVARVWFDGVQVHFMSVHATRPRSAGTLRTQQKEIAAVADLASAAAAAGATPVLIGDLNVAATSKALRRLRADGGLADTQQGHPLQVTWPSGWPPPFQIAIDHALHGAGLRTVGRTTGPRLGGDHLPLTVTLVRAAD